MRMQWCDLLFAHWTCDAGVLRKLIPVGLELDLFEGRAYIGAVPFLMKGVSPRWVPHGVAFPELNLRTYVTAGGKPGVWFFSLDAANKLAVRIARRLFYLPYFDAKFQIANNSDHIKYSSVRTHKNEPAALFEATYNPVGDVYQSQVGTLDSWLTDRFCLYSADKAGKIYRGDIAHESWPLQRAVADIHVNTLGDWLGIEMKGRPETLHFAKSLDVRAGVLRACSPAIAGSPNYQEPGKGHASHQDLP